MKNQVFAPAALSLFLLLLSYLTPAYGQNTIGGSNGHPSAILDLQSTSKGLLLPRMTTAQRDAISNPAEGLLVYNTTLGCVQINLGTGGSADWSCVSTGLSAGDMAVLMEILEDSGSPGGASNANGQPVSLLQLQSIGLTGLNPAYIGAYQAAIQAETGLSNPPSVTQVQLIIDAVNAAIAAVLAEVLEDSDSPSGANNTNGTPVSLPQLQSLPLTGVNPAYLISYQDAIQAETGFSNPATLQQLQAVINAVNAAVGGVLAQIGAEGDSPDAVNSMVTAAQLASLPVTGVVPVNEIAYQNYIDNNPNSFGAPATVAEVQAMVTAVNSAVTSVLAQIGSEGDSPDVVNSEVTAAQLASLPVTGVLPANEIAYQNYIDNNPNSFSAPATVAEVQAMLTAVNSAIAGVMTEILEDSNAAGGANNANGTAVSLAQLQSLPLTGINPAYTSNYQAAINAETNFSNLPTLAQVQAIIDAVNASAGTISTLNCAGATTSGALAAGIAASGVSTSVPYTGGNGGFHNGQTVGSTGITGLTATLTAGTFASGSGNLSYAITGTPSGVGTASFALSIGGQSCTLSLTVSPPPPSISSLDCGGATNNGSLVSGYPACGVVSSVVSYTGGNGGTYSEQTVSSTGVTGLTATLAAGTLASGSGSLTYTITGTPSGPGTASFLLSIGGQSCTLNRTVSSAPGGCGAYVACGEWKQFMCHNLGANTSTDPFTPSWELNGHYYEWGRNPTCFGRDGADDTNPCTGPVYGAAGPWGNTTDNDNAGAIPGWSTTSAADGAWLDGSKTVNDPCPVGWRVPTATQLTGVIDNTLNPRTSVGSWTISTTNYTSGYRFGQSLFLPAAGNRSNSNGSLLGRGSSGYYWSSSESSSIAQLLYFTSGGAVVSASNRTNGFSLRCVAE